MRIIAHLDMDAFFAAIEERDKPRLEGKPIVVGADPVGGKGRGVVSTANYMARKYGIHSAMPISKAWALAEAARKKGEPETVFMSGSYEKYSEVSQKIFTIVQNDVEIVEQVSVDEAYLDLSLTGSYEKAREVAQKIKQDIKEKEHLTASVGIGPNKLIAKIASDMQKPDGLTLIKEEDAEKFLEPLSIRKIPGIGPKTEAVFLKKEIRIVKDLKKFSESELEEMLGVWGNELYQKIRGIDNSPLITEWEAKSIGEQTTFNKDTREPSILIECIKELASDVHRRFQNENFRVFGRIVITVRFDDFTTKTRSKTLKAPTSSLETIQFEALHLLLPFLEKKENPNRKLIRLLGVRVEKLG